jgi:hypothetical protein
MAKAAALARSQGPPLPAGGGAWVRPPGAGAPRPAEAAPSAAPAAGRAEPASPRRDSRRGASPAPSTSIEGRGGPYHSVHGVCCSNSKSYIIWQ